MSDGISEIYAHREELRRKRKYLSDLLKKGIKKFRNSYGEGWLNEVKRLTNLAKRKKVKRK